MHKFFNYSLNQTFICMKRIILFCSAIVIASLSVFASDVPLSRLSTLAARQRGATLKLLEAYVFIKGNSNVQQHKKDIERTAAFMDMSIDLLIKKAPSADIKMKTETLNNVWAQYKKVVTDDVSADVQTTINQSELTFKAADDVVSAYITFAQTGAENASTKTSNIIKTMAQCCALRGRAEKIAIYYALYQFKLLPNVRHTEIVLNNTEEINNGFTNLMLSDLTTTDIYSELSKLSINWKPFYESVKEANGVNVTSKKLDLAYVQNTMKTFFEDIDQLVSAYGNLLKD